ncbi:caspase family protein [Iningainema sp. BLCCT55]|uniref:Caspase family protein n=2 Tax=Iningainema TaxID=1932705 RepID=A0A8J7BYN6_9CYAN|nr:caspase family protein [Iningainema tapete BLCC-T55]
MQRELTQLDTNNAKLFALLIGIDCYLPNTLPDGSSYKSLGGCVRDINHVESFLRTKLQVPQAHILKLTASHTDGIMPLEPPEQLPTYDNIVAKFKQLTDLAQPQDEVYIHYSGHGGRSVTSYPELKGSYGVDESLVPTDIGNSEARYLRDLELAKLLQNMVDKGLVVTLVLDSCHSGGATRERVNDSNIRGLANNIIDTTPRPTDSLVASTEELIQNWQKLTQGQQNTRNVTAASGWLPEPKGYVLLAACRDNELAREYPFNGRESNGALTYWLLDSLEKLGTDSSLKVLHDRILAKVNSQFQQQTPMLQGESDRLIFGGKSTKPQSAILVKKVDVAKNQVILQIGEAQGVRKGAEFAIYQLGTTDFSQTEKRVALAKVIKVRAEESVAEITKILLQEKPGNNLRLYIPPAQAAQTPPTLSEGTIEDGASALLLSPSIKLVRKVRLLQPLENQQLPKGIDYQEALAAVTRKENIEGNGWVEFLSSDEQSDEPVTYQVSVNTEGEYEILDAGGELINLRPPLKVGEPNAAANIVKRLVHLSKYQATLQLDNNDPTSSLVGKLKVDICRTGENRGELLPINAPGNVPTIEDDEYAILRIRNESTQVLNITVLAIQPDWSISQIHPEGASAFEPLDPNREKLVRIHTSLPEGYTESADILKVFATVGATNFRCLELPALDKPLKGAQVFRANNPLEELLAAVASEQPPNREVSAAAYPSEKWTTEQLKLVVKE